MPANAIGKAKDAVIRSKREEIMTFLFINKILWKLVLKFKQKKKEFNNLAGYKNNLAGYKTGIKKALNIYLK